MLEFQSGLAPVAMHLPLLEFEENLMETCCRSWLFVFAEMKTL